MNISFQGYKNIGISKEQLVKQGSHFIDGHVCPSKKIETDYYLNCTLTNDSTGDHLQKFLDSVKKWPQIYQRACVKDNNIELSVNNIKCNLENNEKDYTTIMLNGFPVISVERAGLAIYEYIAKLTTSLINSDLTNPTQKKYLEEMGEHINKRAIDVIENLS